MSRAMQRRAGGGTREGGCSWLLPLCITDGPPDMDGTRPPSTPVLCPRQRSLYRTDKSRGRGLSASLVAPRELALSPGMPCLCHHQNAKGLGDMGGPWVDSLGMRVLQWSIPPVLGRHSPYGHNHTTALPVSWSVGLCAAGLRRKPECTAPVCRIHTATDKGSSVPPTTSV